MGPGKEPEKWLKTRGTSVAIIGPGYRLSRLDEKKMVCGRYLRRGSNSCSGTFVAGFDVRTNTTTCKNPSARRNLVQGGEEIPKDI